MYQLSLFRILKKRMFCTYNLPFHLVHNIPYHSLSRSRMVCPCSNHPHNGCTRHQWPIEPRRRVTDDRETKELPIRMPRLPCRREMSGLAGTCARGRFRSRFVQQSFACIGWNRSNRMGNLGWDQFFLPRVYCGNTRVLKLRAVY